VTFDEIVARSGLPAELADQVYATATMTRPRIDLTPPINAEESPEPPDNERGFLQLLEG
jgi:hypothetical protein